MDNLTEREKEIIVIALLGTIDELVKLSGKVTHPERHQAVKDEIHDIQRLIEKVKY